MLNTIFNENSNSFKALNAPVQYYTIIISYWGKKLSKRTDGMDVYWYEKGDADRIKRLQINVFILHRCVLSTVILRTLQSYARKT